MSAPSAESTRYRGETTIAEHIVAKVSGLAARKVPGVHSMGSGSVNPFGKIKHVVGSPDLSEGIHAEVGSSEVAVDVVLIAHFGVRLQQLCDSVREAVYTSVQELVGLRVIEVNVEVAEVRLSSPREAPRTRARVE